MVRSIVTALVPNVCRVVFNAGKPIHGIAYVPGLRQKEANYKVFIKTSCLLIRA